MTSVTINPTMLEHAPGFANPALSLYFPEVIPGQRPSGKHVFTGPEITKWTITSDLGPHLDGKTNTNPEWAALGAMFINFTLSLDKTQLSLACAEKGPKIVGPQCRRMHTLPLTIYAADSAVTYIIDLTSKTELPEVIKVAPAINEKKYQIAPISLIPCTIFTGTLKTEPCEGFFLGGKWRGQLTGTCTFLDITAVGKQLEILTPDLDTFDSCMWYGTPVPGTYDQVQPYETAKPKTKETIVKDAKISPTYGICQTLIGRVY